MNLLHEINEAGFTPLEAPQRVAKGGSSRVFVRFEDLRYGACVACLYDAEKRENFLYASHAEFLSSCGVPVPRVYFHDEEKRLLIMQSGGDKDLCALENLLHELGPAYTKALEGLGALHVQASKEYAKAPFELMAPFDAALYDWEQNYFFENCLEAIFGLKLDSGAAADFARIKDLLLKEPRVLLHRDFQSQNIMVSGAGADVQVCFIDFQGMRLGVPWYDLASIVFDPYMNLSADFREGLFKYYFDITKADFGLAEDAARGLFYLSGAQRLMQALGAYGFLALKKGKAEYLNHVAPALENLEFCARQANLKALAELARAGLKNAKNAGL